MSSPKKTEKRRLSAKRTLFVTSILLLLCLISYISHIFIKVGHHENVFSPNIYINETSISGLTYDEARDKIQETWVSQFLKQPVILTSSTNPAPVKLDYEILGVSYNLTALLDEAFAYSHDGNVFERYKRYLDKDKNQNPLHLTLKPSVNEQKLNDTLNNYIDHFYQAPIDATMKRTNGTFVFTADSVGYKLDLDALVSQLTQALLENTPIEMDAPLLTVQPTYTESYLKQLQTPLSSFSTSYNNADLSRNENIRLAALKINKLLLPDEKFMFSKQLEPIDVASGYKDAKVISNGSFTEGLGGGICQVSSTLYNAIIQTDLDIYMRRNHSLPVGYTPLGLDATYATNSVDFQFINNSGHPLYIESYTANNKVYVNLYGHKDFKPDYTTKFESVLEEEILPGTPRYEDDPKLPKGTEIQKSAGKPGYKITVYKHYYKNGGLIKKEKLNTSTYKPQAPIIRRGTMELPVASPMEPTPTTP